MLKASKRSAIIFSVVCSFVLPGVVTHARAEPAAAEKLQKTITDAGGAEVFTRADYNKSATWVRHMIFVRYKESTTEEQKEEVMTRYFLLKQRCTRNGSPYIGSLEAGIQKSQEGTAMKMDQVFTISFKSEGDRNYFVGKPLVSNSKYYDAAQDNFRRYLEPLVQEQIVFDYESIRAQ